MKFVFLDEPVVISAEEKSEQEIEIQVSASGGTASIFVIGFGERAPCVDHGPLGAPVGPTLGSEALDIDIGDMAGRSGHFPLEARLEAARDMFPELSNWIGTERVAAMGAITQLVGMIVPGLHSVFGGLSLRLCDPPGPSSLAFKVASIHVRFRTLDHVVWGAGIDGSLSTLVRRPPTPQMSSELIGKIVRPGEFENTASLVIGGSRGLGELTAKIIAAGGGKVVITYNVGKTDALSVAEQIRDHGGDCAVVQFDATLPPPPQIINLAANVTHAYYFATGGIFRPQAKTYDRDRFDGFASIYLDGFYNLCEVLAASGTPKSIFYPSTIFVVSRPRGMTEYVMVKAAGELLCEEIGIAMPALRLTTDRLPRVLTDQTASIVPVSTAPAIDVILPIIRKLQRDDRMV